MLGLTLQSQLQRFGKGSGGKEDVGKQTGNEKPKGGVLFRKWRRFQELLSKGLMAHSSTPVFPAQLLALQFFYLSSLF